MTPPNCGWPERLFRLGVREIAALADVTPFTVSRYETEQGGIRHDTAQRLEAALNKLGVSLSLKGGRPASATLLRPNPREKM